MSTFVLIFKQFVAKISAGFIASGVDTSVLLVVVFAFEFHGNRRGTIAWAQKLFNKLFVELTTKRFCRAEEEFLCRHESVRKQVV